MAAGSLDGGQLAGKYPLLNGGVIRADLCYRFADETVSLSQYPKNSIFLSA
jgi:hypothetical protein